MTPKAARIDHQLQPVEVFNFVDKLLRFLCGLISNSNGTYIMLLLHTALWYATRPAHVLK